MKPIRALWDRFNAVMFEMPVHHPLQLGAYRIIFASWFLFSRQIPSTRWAANIPADFRNPAPGLTAIIPHPSPAIALVLDVALIASLVAVLVGFKTRAMSLSLGLLGIISSAIAFSFGKIDHTVFLWIIPLVMSTSGWGARLSIDSLRGPRSEEKYAVPGVPFLSILLALAFATAGLPKLAGGWLSPDTLATKSYFLEKIIRGETNSSTSLWEGLESTFLWEAADWFTVAFELSFVALILWPAAYRLLLFVTIIFHIVVLFVLNINFESSLVLYLVFVAAYFDVERVRSFERTLMENKAVLYGGVGVIAVAVATQLGGPGLLRAVMEPIGVEDWGTTLVTQIVFLVAYSILLARSFKTPSEPVSEETLVATGDRS